MENKSTPKDMVTGTGPGAAVEVEDKRITMTNWTRGKVTSGLLSIINLKFFTITFLINIGNYLLSVIYLVELGTRNRI